MSEEKKAIEQLDYELTYSWVHNSGISKETLTLFKKVTEKLQKEIEELNTELEIRIKWQQYFEILQKLEKDLKYYKDQEKDLAFIANQSEAHKEFEVIIKYLESLLREVNNGIY